LTVYDDNFVKVYDANIVNKYLLKNNIKALGTLAFYGIDMNDVRAAARSASTININTFFNLDTPSFVPY